MTKTLRLFNLLLALLVLVLLGTLAQSLMDMPASSVEARPASPAKRTTVLTSETREAVPSSKPMLPPLSTFGVILHKDVFKSPFPEPSAPPPPVAKKPEPPPPPLPTLVGTIFVGEERKAILKDGNRSESYTTGQPVAGGTLVKIEKDHVMIQRGDSQVEIPLKASIQSVSPPSQATISPRAALPGKAPAPGVPAGDGSATKGPGAITQPAPAPAAVEAPPTATADPAPTPSPSVQSEPEGGRQLYRQPNMTPEERLRRLRENFLNRRNRTQAQ